MSDDARVVLRWPGEQWRRPQVSSYQNERELQELLTESPTLIPGVGPAVAVDELTLPDGGRIDVVAVEPSGAITLVECKLAANSEARLAVVSQIVSYASELSELRYEEFDERFHRRAGHSVADAVEAVATDDELEWDAEEFRRALAGNLAAGSLRLVVAVDEITNELKRIIEYLNLHTSGELEIVGLELSYVADGDVEILLPRAYGLESARLTASRRQSHRRTWSVEDVYAALDGTCSVEGLAAVRRLADDALSRGGKLQPGQGAYPTMSGYVRLNQEARALWAVYADPAGPSASRVSLNFGSWRQSLPESALETIVARFEQHEHLAGVARTVRERGFDVYPTIPIDATLAQSDTVDVIVEVLGPHLPPRQR